MTNSLIPCIHVGQHVWSVQSFTTIICCVNELFNTIHIRHIYKYCRQLITFYRYVLVVYCDHQVHSSLAFLVITMQKLTRVYGAIVQINFISLTAFLVWHLVLLWCNAVTGIILHAKQITNQYTKYQTRVYQGPQYRQ